MTTGDRPVRRSRAWLVYAAALGVLLAVLLAVGAQGPGTVVIPPAVAVLAVGMTAWTVVRARRRRAEYEARLTAWAAERAADQERIRIAGELHDIVSNGLGVIIMRAAAARRVPGESEQALVDVERLGREAVAELRRMLTVLRASDRNSVPLRPVRSLSDLAGIVDAARAAGHTARLSVDALGEVSPGVQATVCAIVQEAIANTSRHAGPTDLLVHLARDGGCVVVVVRDDGPRTEWHPTLGAGHGLVGLRERVDALGGTLDACPAATGFLLTARLPDGAAR
ncbi:sensor histidine kinase [Actinokineospora pegani]|uniref:sensor histidine kinase n=1 Tax=Actinokineospora pegani TaxID=2654637 RepID=UPI0012E99550|nr:histidine kinase [Actinokineospora pegani]